MKLKVVITGIVSFLPLISLSFSLFADNGNYQDFLVGDRAAGMGGAVAASTNDLDACYYNPGGLANVTGSRIALSVSLYGIYRLSVADGLGPHESYHSREFESIPSTFGSILKASDTLALAFAVFTPDEITYNTQQSFEKQPYLPGLYRSDYYASSLDDATTWIGPSLGFKAGDRISLGCGIYLVYRSLNNNQNWTYLYTTGDGQEVVRVGSRQYRYNYTNYGLLGVFGAQYALTDNVSLGLTVYTPTVNLTGEGSLFYGVSLGDPEEDTLVTADNMTSKNQVPTEIIASAAYRKPKQFTIGVDLSYHLPTSYTELQGRDTWSGEEIRIETRREPVVNLNLGGEYYVVKNYPLRAGFFTNLSSSPPVDAEDPRVGKENIDMYGVSASVGNESEHTTINVGVNYVWGKGRTLGIGDNFQPVDVAARESYLFLFLSSAYIF